MAESTPRISVNKLGEYLVQADSSRRTRIIRDQKELPVGRMVSAYREAKDAIVKTLLGVEGPSLLHRSTQLASDKRGTARAVINRGNCALALEHFINILPQLPTGVAYAAAPQGQASLEIAGVEVSIAPDLIIHATRGSTAVIGAVKLHFPKDDEKALGPNGSQFVAVLINQWLAQQPASRRVPAPEFCLSIDVFRQTVHAAPRSQQRRLEKIRDGCEEIAARWPRL